MNWNTKNDSLNRLSYNLINLLWCRDVVFILYALFLFIFAGLAWRLFDLAMAKGGLSFLLGNLRWPGIGFIRCDRNLSNFSIVWSRVCDLWWGVYFTVRVMGMGDEPPIFMIGWAL
ncbi:hypothetical protein GCM10011391_40050 [Pullulanibacillus camelliae]|uniref:Uncharacterized protein n=1 Tax=Pullulanibacillus camelliae TaxID=1707096 RepID=A0A8J2YNI9_9BACL|nr:hypothetical protein GCM10011391_40050 [Pullulanibacillus camelliae]